MTARPQSSGARSTANRRNRVAIFNWE